MLHTDQIEYELKKLFPFTEEQCRAVTERIIIRSYRRKDFFLAPPAVSNYVGLVLEGSFRMFRNKISDDDIPVHGIPSPKEKESSPEEKDNTLHFFSEGDWIADFESFVVQRPTLNHIQCMTRAELAILSIHDLHALIRDNQAFVALGRIMKDWSVSTQHVASLINDTPDKRYQSLLQTHPGWIIRFPQMYLASYLGMTRETFSRVKRRNLTPAV